MIFLLVQKEGASLLTDMWSFTWFDSSTQMEVLWRIIDCESLENFPNNFYDRVCLENCKSVLYKLQLRYNQNLPQISFRICSKENCIPGFFTEIFPSGFCKRALYKISEKLLFDIFVISYLTILQAFNLKVATLLKWSVWQKHIELTFNIYIWMPMPRRKHRDLQVVVLIIFKDKDIKDKSLSWKWTN